MRSDGKLQAPSGLYIVNHDVLTEANRNSRWFLRRLYETEWDLIIVDEAHHYARWTKPAFIFAPNRNMTDYDQGISGGTFGKILALTATPFELTPGEMVQLLALVHADKQDLQLIEQGLDLYLRRLDRFFALRQRSASDPLRLDSVKTLKRLRDVEVLGADGGGVGLQALLRRYVIRNTKSQNERKYFFANKVVGEYNLQQFQKLDDLRRTIKEAPLLPFEGPDALFYLELRELIDETIQKAREGIDHRTFVTTDLRQGLSSYPQIAESKLLKRNLESAGRLKGLVDSWNKGKNPKLHPKVAALADLVEMIALQEIEKVKASRNTWFSKVLVFNKLIGGTAPHLREVLTRRLEPIFTRHLDDHLQQAGLGTRVKFAATVRSSIRSALADIKTRMKGWREDQYCLVPAEFSHESLVAYRGKHLVDVFRETLVKRAEQSLFLIHAALRVDVPTEDAIRGWLERELTGEFEYAVRQIIDSYLDDEATEGRPREELIEIAEPPVPI